MKIKKLLDKFNKSIDVYLIKEEKPTLVQVGLLIVMFLLFYVTMNLLGLSILGSAFNFNILDNDMVFPIKQIMDNNLLEFAISDIIVSIIAIFLVRRNSHYILIVGYLPITSIVCLIYPEAIYSLLILICSIIHAIFTIFALIKLKDIFVKYSKDNNLNYFIVVAFLMMIICFGISLVAEGQNKSDAIYHSIAVFTSNGYGEVVENTFLGKLSSNLLMVIGYIMSTVGTASLASLLIRNYLSKTFKKELKKTKRELAEIKKTNEKITKELEEIKELIKK